MPGTPHNLVGVSYPGGGEATVADRDDRDLSSMERFQWMGGPAT